MPYVYRIEDNRGRGPYRVTPWGVAPHEGGEMPHNRRLPPPQDDGIPSPPRWPAKFGFRNKAQLRYWFTKADRKWLALHYRLRLCRYHVPSDAVVYGRRQVVFDARRATRVNELDIVKAA